MRLVLEPARPGLATAIGRTGGGTPSTLGHLVVFAAAGGCFFSGSRSPKADQHHCDVLKEACIEFICFSTMDDIVATQGFVDLQKNCPSVLVDAFVKMSIIKKT
ncbi:hypothetical protein EJB05_09051, partial [Eragrostis curvula]